MIFPMKHGLFLFRFITFNGGLATAIAEGLPMEKALQFATCTAAISVTRFGSSPSMPYRHEIVALMEKEFGTTL